MLATKTRNASAYNVLVSGMLVSVSALLAVYSVVFALYVSLPGRWVEGYARDASGRRLRYRLNGLLVFGVVVGGYVALAANGVMAWDFFYLHRVGMLATAFVVGLAFTLASVLPGQPVRASLLDDLYLGRFENPQWLNGRVDVKMFLYLVGATMLELCVLSFAAHHVLTHPVDPSPGVLLYAALFSFFLVDYLCFERVHLYTYDFVAERVGFKLGWGCLVFYPFFYCVGLWFAADRENPHTSRGVLIVAQRCCSSRAGCRARRRCGKACRSSTSRCIPSALPLVRCRSARSARATNACWFRAFGGCRATSTTWASC